MAPNQQLPKAPTRNLKFVIKYIKETARFDTLLFCPNQGFFDVFCCFFRYVPIDSYHQLQITTNYNSFLHYVVIYRYISDINILCSIHCKRMSLLNVVSYVFINVFYLVLFCIHVCVDVIKKTYFLWLAKFWGATSASALQKFYFAFRSFNFCLSRFILK